VIDVVLLGAGGMMPLPGRWLSSLLVRANGELTLFDCGEGTQIAWRLAGWNLRRLGAICITHTHADHIAGLPGILHAVANADRVEPLDLFGPIGTARVVDGLRVIAPVLPFDLRVIELSHGDRFHLPGGLNGRCVAGEHGLPVLAYRASLDRSREFLPEKAEDLGIPVTLWKRLQTGEPVTWAGTTVDPEQVLGPPRTGIAVAYITDTRPVPVLRELASGVDLLVCEGTYGDDGDEPKAQRNLHLTFREAATLASEADIRLLWLTHFSPGLENPAAFSSNATDVFANTTIGYAGLTTRLDFSEH
jgi:ribonuclease Z